MCINFSNKNTHEIHENIWTSKIDTHIIGTVLVIRFMVGVFQHLHVSDEDDINVSGCSEMFEWRLVCFKNFSFVLS